MSKKQPTTDELHGTLTWSRDVYEMHLRDNGEWEIYTFDEDGNRIPWIEEDDDETEADD